MASVSDAYQVVADSFVVDADNTAFIEAATEFNKSYSDSIYNNLVSLQLAKLAVDAGDMGTAEQHLRDAYTKAKDPTVEHFARLRLARVLVAADKADEALKLIADTKDGAFKAAYELVRGDIWMAKGDEARARAAYESAKALNAEGPVNPSLEMLLTDLAASGTASEAKADG